MCIRDRNENDILYEIDEFKSRKDFISLGINLAKYDIVFLDVNMDELDGICLLYTSSAVIAQCSEHTYLKSGKRIDGSMFSCTSLGVKPVSYTHLNQQLR